MNKKTSNISVDVALIDIDGTITVPIRESDFAVSPLEHLVRLVIERQHVSRERHWRKS